MSVNLSNLFNDEAENIRGKVIGVYVLLFAFNIAAWMWAIVAFHQFPLLLGTAALAYSFGLRGAAGRAVDQDGGQGGRFWWGCVTH